MPRLHGGSDLVPPVPYEAAILITACVAVHAGAPLAVSAIRAEVLLQALCTLGARLCALYLVPCFCARPSARQVLFIQPAQRGTELEHPCAEFPLVVRGWALGRIELGEGRQGAQQSREAGKVGGAWHEGAQPAALEDECAQLAQATPAIRRADVDSLVVREVQAGEVRRERQARDDSELVHRKIQVHQHAGPFKRERGELRRREGEREHTFSRKPCKAHVRADAAASLGEQAQQARRRAERLVEP
eukprot:CAMPEP_0179838190 /NCGR_PEP_ID=MMETSP0982-20121206/525_1 /TAXON_ID=483367 /ORGANISM="non described non described, Strain CCMP 2436" /LENGTH=245 /DNA_ID=CAMNT_0021721507 /DNA_START=219 /DNA_END=953 /DNA_ORIENTATION=+